MSLLNFGNFLDGTISGLDDEELVWVTEESNQRFFKELSSDFWNTIDDQNKEEGMYDHLDEKIEKEMNAAELEAIPKGTRYITNFHVKNSIIS